MIHNILLVLCFTISMTVIFMFYKTYYDVLSSEISHYLSLRKNLKYLDTFSKSDSDLVSGLITDTKLECLKALSKSKRRFFISLFCFPSCFLLLSFPLGYVLAIRFFIPKKYKETCKNFEELPKVIMVSYLIIGVIISYILGLSVMMAAFENLSEDHTVLSIYQKFLLFTLTIYSIGLICSIYYRNEEQLKGDEGGFYLYDLLSPEKAFNKIVNDEKPENHDEE